MILIFRILIIMIKFLQKDLVEPFGKTMMFQIFKEMLSFDKSSLFKLLSLTTTDVNPKWYCYFWQEGVFNLNYFEEGYDKTIIEISKNEKDLFEIDEIAELY